MNFCTNCGKPISTQDLFCTSCGIKFEPKNSAILQQSDFEQTKSTVNLESVNKQIKIQNSQSKTVRKSLVFVFVGLILTMLPFMENNPLTGIWAFALIGFFIFLSALIVAIIFKSRAKKLNTLISGKNVLASWTLDSTEKSEYVNYLFENEKSKNKGIFWITTILIVVIFGIFIIVIEEGKAAMIFVMIALIAFIALFAFGMPFYYKRKNSNNDGIILIGKKYAYVNGYFHNWDFPLSGIKKASIIKEPFYGLYFQYYYTDRTFTNTEELNIPAPQNIDLQNLVNELKN